MRNHFTVIGAGLAGPLAAILLAQRGYAVELLERRTDPRQGPAERGRSINLALAARGLHALERAGVLEQVRPLLLPMPGRMLHDVQGRLTFIPYGQHPHEVNYSVSRSALNELLLHAATGLPDVTLQFNTSVQADLHAQRLLLQTPAGAVERPLQRVIAADGAGSMLRGALIEATHSDCRIDMLTHGYKELTIPALPDGSHAIEARALHIWPRGGFMLIALPNLNGSFTATLFLPHTGPQSFADLHTPAKVRRFFEREFADATALMPELDSEFFEHPVGEMGTVRTSRWAVEDRCVLIGDAAHAILPFHGQGMNCAFEDCIALQQSLERSPDVATAFAAFEQDRIPQTDAIAEMAIENYVEMRDSVRDPGFQLRHSLALELERRFPDRFVPRYSMVMFHHEIPYAEALRRGQIHTEILHELTRNVRMLREVDFDLARQLVTQRLPAFQ